MKRALPCGSWPSPLSVEQTAGAQRRFLQPRVSGGAVYWLEGRPEEGGRVVLMRERQGQRAELTPRPFSVSACHVMPFDPARADEGCLLEQGATPNFIT